MNRRDFMAIVGSGALLSASAGRLSAQDSKPEIEKAVKLALDKAVADPSCFLWDNGYYLLGTSHPGRSSNSDLLYTLYYSPDLLEWIKLGGILERPEYEGSHKANYWAPEILPYKGKFYLYYTSDSFGDPYRRHVRLAVADRVTGPYIDQGKKLVQQPSIDGHPCLVSDDEIYLFYTGNEGNDHQGQMIMDRFVSPTELENKPRKVFPSETVPWEEGGFTLKHEGLWYLFTSQGNWRDSSYHVLAARAEHPAGPWERLKNNNGSHSVISTIEGLWWGPGHNSIFRDRVGRIIICFHAHDEKRTGRWAWIAPIEWEKGCPVVRQPKKMAIE